MVRILGSDPGFGTQKVWYGFHRLDSIGFHVSFFSKKFQKVWYGLPWERMWDLLLPKVRYEMPGELIWDLMRPKAKYEFQRKVGFEFALGANMGPFAPQS